MKSEISATDAARRFSEVLNRVRYRNETFVVKRGGEPVCEIVPVRAATFTGRDFVELLRSLPHPDKEYLDDDRKARSKTAEGREIEMAALIDSSVFIAGERGRIDLTDLLASLGDEPLALSAVTASELLYGLHRARTPAQRERRNAYVEAIFSQMTVLAFDLHVARVHSAVSAELDRTGRQVGAHDLMIAATAMAHDYRVATRDLRSFPKIQGLETVRI